MPATIPTKTAGSLGEVLTDTRTPVSNELSAVHVERLKSLAIEISAEIGATGGPAEGSILARLEALDAGIDWRNVLGTLVAVGGDVSIAADAGVLVVDTTSNRTLTLPDPATVSGVLPFLVIDASNNAAAKPMTLARFGAEQIDGVAASKSLGRNGGRWWVWTNGTNWYTVEATPHVGPATSTDNAIARWDGATGDRLQNSSATIDDSGNLDVAGGVTAFSATIDEIFAGYVETSSNLLVTGSASVGAGLGVTGDIIATGAVAVGGDVEITGNLSVSGLFSAPVPVDESTTTRTLTDADHGRVIRCTHASGCTITVPSLGAGSTIAIVRESGAVALTASGVTLRYDSATFNAAPAAQWSLIVLTWLGPTSVLVSGDLDPV